MIGKVLDHYIDMLVETFKNYNINLPAQYTPEVPGLVKYAKDFSITNLETHPNYSSDKYANKIMYTFGTPVPPIDKLNNTYFKLYTVDNRTDYSNDTWTITKTAGVDPVIEVITKQKDNVGSISSSTGVVRDLTPLEIPVEFIIITESKSLLFDFILLYHQVIKRLIGLDVPVKLNPNEPGTDDMLPYYIKYDDDSLTVDYADFSGEQVYNTLAFSAKVIGGFASNYYKTDQTVETVNLSINRL